MTAQTTCIPLAADHIECEGAIIHNAHVEQAEDCLVVEGFVSEIQLDFYGLQGGRYVLGSTKVYVHGQRYLRKTTKTETAGTWQYEETGDGKTITFKEDLPPGAHVFIEFTLACV